MTKLALALVAAMVLSFVTCGGASADLLTFTTTNLTEMDHDYYYKWGISTSGSFTTRPVNSGQLIFTGIYDWTTESNNLWVHLLDSATNGITSYTDSSNTSDAFAGQGLYLTEFINLTTTPTTLTYNFTTAQIATLNQYLVNGNNIAFGFDPDCHFYDCTITFQMNQPVGNIPEPGTLALIGTGLVGGLGIIRRRLMR